MSENIVLGREEVYKAFSRVWSFKQVDDIVNGMELRLTNMAGGFPFEFGVHCGLTANGSTCAESFPIIPKNTSMFRKSCAVLKAVMSPNASLRQSIGSKCAATSRNSGCSGCSSVYGRSAGAMPTSANFYSAYPMMSYWSRTQPQTQEVRPRFGDAGTRN